MLEGAGKDGEGLVYFGSGQMYTYTNFTAECMQEPVNIVQPDWTTTKRGETGQGAMECYERAVQELQNLGYNTDETPLAFNSIIALNAKDGSYAWHVQTTGIDAWGPACGTFLDQACFVPVPGPDWDVGGIAPILAEMNGRTVVISHHKGGALFVVDAISGQVIRSSDVCVGSVSGGIHFGLSYDPETKTIFVSCSGGTPSGAFAADAGYNSVAADGTELCLSGIFNAIDLETGNLKWQALPAYSQRNDAQSSCKSVSPNPGNVVDERFKFGVSFDRVIKSTVIPGVPVHVMPENEFVPIKLQKLARAHGPAANSNGIVYWPTMNGVVYANHIHSGEYVTQLVCDEGSVYGGVSTARGRVSFACGYNLLDPEGAGDNFAVYAVSDYYHHGDVESSSSSSTTFESESESEHEPHHYDHHKPEPTVHSETEPQSEPKHHY